MARITWGAETLIDQVRALRKNVEVEYDEPDSLDVRRTIRFDKATSEWLQPLLSVQLDPRIESLDVTSAGYLHVTFQAGPVADGRDPFPLQDVDRVLNAPNETENVREDLTTAEFGSTYDPEPKKAPAKKAAAKKA